jgi:hypothetical protein
MTDYRCIVRTAVVGAFVVLVNCGGDMDDRGASLSRRYCQSCHLYPEPAQLPTHIWREAVLPKMGALFGHYGKLGRAYYVESGAGTEELFPTETTMSEADWAAIQSYYLGHSPNQLNTAGVYTVLSPTDTLDWFHPEDLLPPQPHFVTLLAAEEGGGVWVGATGPGRHPLRLLDGSGRVRSHFLLPSAPAAYLRRWEKRYVACLGKYTPTDVGGGAILRLPVDEAVPDGYPYLVRNLRRPTAFAFTAGNELLTAEFGNLRGSLSLWADSTAPPQVLAPTPGWQQVELVDWNGNGREDILALAGQGDERLDVFLLQQDGSYIRQNLLRWPPSYGTVAFIRVDLDGDGAQDIVTVHGDNADYEPIVKPYHGLRLYRRGADNALSLQRHIPLPGAYACAAADFDGDGDMDLAAIAHFADYQQREPLTFVLLEQTQPFAFRPRTASYQHRGRWMTLEATDIDRDGDMDIALGSFTAFPIRPDPRGWQEYWRKEGTPVLLLRNRGRN